MKILGITKRSKRIKHILALGPVTANHGEAKMFNHSCGNLQDVFSLEVINSVRFSNKILRSIMNVIACSYLLIRQRPTHLYLSYSRNKIMLLSLFLTILPIIRLYNIKCIYHIHDTSLVDELSGVLGKVVRLLYLNCVSITIIPNKTLLQYALLHPNMRVEFLLNPYIGSVQRRANDAKECFSFISYPSMNKNLDLAIKLIQSQNKRLEVIGWSKSDANLLYPDLNIDPDKIIFLGKLSHSKAMEKLSGSLGLISVSNREAMPLNIIEALFRKVPIYALKHTGYIYFFNTFSSMREIHDLENAHLDNAELSLEQSFKKAKEAFDTKKYKVDLIRIFE